MTEQAMEKQSAATLTSSPRRGFLMQSARVLAGATFMGVPVACVGEEPAPPPEPADGSFDKPYSPEDPGEWTDKIEIHQPWLFAAPAENGYRLWVEVLDINQPLNHVMEAEHFIEQIVITDNFGNVVANGSFAYNNQARLITTVEIPAGVEYLYVYEHCNLHGWWRSRFNVVDFAGEFNDAEPAGDFRRPLDVDNPGEWPDKIEVHLPVMYKNDQGDLIVEVGDRAADKLHVMEAGHYISTVMLYDHYAQLRQVKTFDTAYDAEPVINFGQQIPSPSFRVIAGCNLHDWWEAIFDPTDVADAPDGPGPDDEADGGT